MDGHRELWTRQQAQQLLKEVYRLTRALPVEERYVASSQIRRAAWSVSNNIAEGNAKRGRPEMRRFLDIAIGSLAEVDSMVAGLTSLYDGPADGKDHLRSSARDQSWNLSDAQGGATLETRTDHLPLSAALCRLLCFQPYSVSICARCNFPE